MKNLRAGFLAVATVLTPLNSETHAQTSDDKDQTLIINTVHPPENMNDIDLDIPSKKLKIDADLLGPLPELQMTDAFKAQFVAAGLTEAQIQKVHSKCKEILLKRPDIRVCKGNTEIFVDADLLGNSPTFPLTEAFKKSLAPHGFTVEESRQILRAAQNARKARPEYGLSLPDKSTVSIDAHKLGPNNELTVGFVMQFDPHYAIDRLTLRDLNPFQRKMRIGQHLQMSTQADSTDQTLMGRIIEHLKEKHGVTAEFIEKERAKCEEIIKAEQAAPATPATTKQLSFG